MSIAANEVKPSKVLIVHCRCGDVLNELQSMNLQIEGLDIELLENPKGKSLQNQINYAVENVTTKHFTFLEFDDEFSKKWIQNIEIYISAYPGVKMFLPIIADVNVEGKFMGYTNEAAWAQDFTNKLGYLDVESLLLSPSFMLSGMVVDTETFKNIGGYKPSIKLSFNYELLLRFLEKGNEAMVIPKIGYQHMNMRPGSLFWGYKQSEDPTIKLSADEAEFWMEVAKKEYFFTEDRNISYVKQTN